MKKTSREEDFTGAMATLEAMDYSEACFRYCTAAVQSTHINGLVNQRQEAEHCKMLWREVIHKYNLWRNSLPYER